MKFTGEKAVVLAERYGLMIRKFEDERRGKTASVPLEDAQWILEHGEPESIFVEAEPEMADLVDKD